MGTKSSISDLSSHFPPSSHLGRAAGTFSIQSRTDRKLYFDGIVVFPESQTLRAHWRPRVVIQRRLTSMGTKHYTKCEVRGFARLKDNLRFRIDEPVFVETMRDSLPIIESMLRYFGNEYPNLNYLTDANERRGLTFSTANDSLFLAERVDRETIKESVKSPPRLLDPYATFCVDQDELRTIQNSLGNSHEVTFNRFDGDLYLHSRAWHSAKQTGFSFGRLGGKNTLNALTMFEALFETGSPIDQFGSTKNESRKEKRVRREREDIDARREKDRRALLSVADLALEDFQTLQRPLENSPYAITSTRRLRSNLADSRQFYVPSQDEADWFPSRVLSDVLSTQGLTTVHLRPRMIEVVKETPFAVYQYFITGQGIWEWYQKRQPARYFRGEFEASASISSVG